MCAYDIIILAGQSNAEGEGRGPVQEEHKVNPDIMQLRTNLSDVMEGDNRIITYPDKTLYVEEAKERDTKEGIKGNFALTFAEEYVKCGMLSKGRKVLIVKAALAGTGFQKKQWGEGCPVEERMHEMIQYALELHPENRIVAFLWHQGEHDAFEGNAPDNYERQLRRLMDRVQNRYDCGNVPFIAGDFCREWKSQNLDICTPILERIQKVFSGEKRGFVETSDLLSNNEKISNGDVIHFCREDLKKLGKRYFEKYCEILGI